MLYARKTTFTSNHPRPLLIQGGELAANDSNGSVVEKLGGIAIYVGRCPTLEDCALSGLEQPILKEPYSRKTSAW